MMKLENNNDWILEIYSLLAKNPRMEVKFFVDNNELAEGFDYTYQEIKRVAIEPWIKYDGDYYTDYNDFIEMLVDLIQAYDTNNEAMRAYPLKNFPRCIVGYMGAA